MIESLAWKPDFARTLERFEAWWQCEVVDRPPITLWIKPSAPDPVPMKQHASLRERWLDVEFAVDSAIAQMQHTVYLADNFPRFVPNVGPELSATPFGCELEFSESTSWASPIIHDAADWARVPKLPLNFANVYWQTIERATDLAIERSEGRFIVGIADLHGSFDILASLRDPQMLCLDVIDCPDLLGPAARRAADAMGEMFDRLYQKIAAADMPCTSWLPPLHAGSAYVPSCDFWCLIGDEFVREMILPMVVREMENWQRSIFHLDGPQALRHLDLLLDMPQLEAVQWAFGAGHGLAAHWIDTYRRIQDAGKAMQVLAETPEDALLVLDALRPEGVYLDIAKPFDDAEQAQQFLRDVHEHTTEARV